MKVVIIGSGGREHAICENLKNSSKIDKVFCIPGNAGTEEIAENINIELSNFENIKNFILEREIDLVIIGPEKPLVDGLVDYLEQTKITVEAVRLDDWANKNNISNIDLLVMDLQGAEVEALKGAGDLLKNVKYIITEGCVQPFYQGAPHIDEITALLEDYGFSLVADNMDTWQADELQGDFFFVRL